MNQTYYIAQLNKNKEVFKAFLSGISEEESLWRPQPDKWCLLEILCHLYDEEREDFRARVKSILEDPTKELVKINPPAWVMERNYISKNYNEMLKKFLQERERSITWLKSLSSPQWDNTYIHPTLGPMKANLFLTNWVAHDYLHFRQILKTKYQYLKSISSEPLDYAGGW